MADEKNNSIVFYRSFYESIMALSTDKERIELLKAICEYAFDGEIYTSDSIYVNALFKAHKFNIDKAIQRRLKNIENGKLGGAPYGNINALKNKTTENNPIQPKTTQKQP